MRNCLVDLTTKTFSGGLDSSNPRKVRRQSYNVIGLGMNGDKFSYSFKAIKKEERGT